MSQLVPCPSCDRHVRLPESSCPFCGGELNAQALGAKYASRRAPVPTGIKRAALMALSTVAAACGGKTDGTGDDTAPIVATETGDTLPVGTPVYGAPPVTSEVAAVTSDDGPSGTLVAIYGAPVPPSSETVTSEPAPSTGGGQTVVDDTWGALPAYGLPPWDLTDVVVNTSAPSLDGDAGVDGGVDGDAGSADVATVVDDFTDLAQPEYGAPIPEQ